MYVTVLLELQEEFKDVIDKIQDDSRKAEREFAIRQAYVVLMKYVNDLGEMMHRIKWISQSIQIKQLLECQSHIAPVNYKRVLTRSILCSLVIAITITLCAQKSTKKVKEL